MARCGKFSPMQKQYHLKFTSLWTPPVCKVFSRMRATIRRRLLPYIRTLVEGAPSVPDGICWPGSHHKCALKALCITQSSSPPV